MRKSSKDINFVTEMLKNLNPKHSFLETKNLNQALQNLQNQFSNLVNTFKDIVFNNYLLSSSSLTESEKRNLLEKINELQNDFKNVLRAMSAVYTQLNTDSPKNGEAFRSFMNIQFDEILDLYNSCTVDSLNANLTKLLHDMYFVFDMCFRAINTGIYQYNKNTENKLPFVKTFNQPVNYITDVDFIYVLKVVYGKGQKLFEEMKNCC